MAATVLVSAMLAVLWLSFLSHLAVPEFLNLEVLGHLHGSHLHCAVESSGERR